MEASTTLLDLLKEDLQIRNLKAIAFTKQQDCIIAQDQGKKALFVYPMDAHSATWVEREQLSHVDGRYIKTFAYLLRKNKLRLITSGAGREQFERLVSCIEYKAIRERARDVAIRSTAARKAGQYIEVNTLMPYVLVHRGEDDEYFIRDSEADNLIREQKASDLYHFCTIEDIILSKAQDW
jgi:hypothetical protein